jgi:hypothetical protein
VERLARTIDHRGPKGLQDSAQGLNLGNLRNKRFALKLKGHRDFRTWFLGVSSAAPFRASGDKPKTQGYASSSHSGPGSKKEIKYPTTQILHNPDRVIR